MIQSVEFSAINEMSLAMRESLRALRTNIQFCGDDIRTILFTSTIPNEGKSTVVLDLARSLGESGKLVLVIDTDLRKSVILKEYSVKSVSHSQIFGLSHYLTGQKKLEEVLYRTNMMNVDVVFAGRSVPNPTEILGRKYFRDILEFGRSHYNYVLIDCAPVSVAIDAVLEAQYCDGAVLVISQEMATSRMILDSKHQLENSGVRILGAVLNKVRMKSSRYGHYYGSYYGNYYGSYYGNDYGQDDDDQNEQWESSGRTSRARAGSRSNPRSAPPDENPDENIDVDWTRL